ncbi:MAG: nucleoside deaminase [Bacteroidia bacterium]|nr:nucleoside deaminase [Bacteroidia bacterium]
MLSIHTDEHFMRQALQLAERAAEEGEVPIGAVVVSQFRIIGKGYNQTERLQDPTAHAEMLAITAACEHLRSKYLRDCTLYVTIEPCPMCAGALRWAQLERVVYGAGEEKFGSVHVRPSLFHPKTMVEGGLMEHDCAAIMQEFFRSRRP